MDKEKRIRVNFSPYLFAQEDTILASKILGLTASHWINPEPFGPIFHFYLDEETSFQNIVDFLKCLPSEFELTYFRRFEPFQSGAGTVVTAQEVESGYLFYNSSHGQDNIWKEISKENLLQELFTHRGYQSFGTVKVRRKIRQAVLGQKAL